MTQRKRDTLESFGLNMECIVQSSLSASMGLQSCAGLSSTPNANCLIVQVIPYITELLAKVHEQQAQAARIAGFQSQFGYVYAILATDAELQLTYVM